jgi:hypothetical protein
MHARQLKAALGELAEQAALRLQAFVEAGQEIPFELDSRSGRGAASLYCYRPLTSSFVAERFPLLRALPAYAPAASLLEDFTGLDRYLVSRGVEPRRPGPLGRAGATLLGFLQEVFGEQSDFHLQPQRLDRALAAIEGSALATPTRMTLIATLHGLAISSDELRLTSGLTIAQPMAFKDAPEQALLPVDSVDHQVLAPLGQGKGEGHLLVLYTVEDPDAEQALAEGAAILRDLLRALRLFGDGRIALGPLAWTRVGSGSWSAFAMGGGGHPHGMLLVTPDQEDELRAFCNLVSRRTPQEGNLPWALRRFEMGCERAHHYDALSDHLLALRGLLTDVAHHPDAEADEVLAGRLAALCATPADRPALAERVLAATALEREAIAGAAVEHAGGFALARETSNHLRALLRDVICGHLPADLATFADELLMGEEDGLGEQALSNDAQAAQVLDLAV